MTDGWGIHSEGKQMKESFGYDIDVLARFFGAGRLTFSWANTSLLLLLDVVFSSFNNPSFLSLFWLTFSHAHYTLNLALQPLKAVHKGQFSRTGNGDFGSPISGMHGVKLRGNRFDLAHLWKKVLLLVMLHAIILCKAKFLMKIVEEGGCKNLKLFVCPAERNGSISWLESETFMHACHHEIFSRISCNTRYT